MAQGDTLTNLKAAAEGENDEWSHLYPHFADVAEEEGFLEVAGAFRAIVVSEKGHEERFLKLAENIEKDRVFKRDGKVMWKCGNCGYLHEGPEAPKPARRAFIRKLTSNCLLRLTKHTLG